MNESLKDSFVVPKLGEHKNVKSYDYHNWFACSSSIMRELARSPAHAWYALNNERKETDAMRLGTATHLAILEPDLFAKKFGCAPEGLDKRTKEGKAAWADLQEQYGPCILKYDQYQQVGAMAESVLKKKKASILLEKLSDVELSGVWTDKASGALCKMRIDGLIRDLGILVDIKTTSDASEDEFLRTLFNYGYDRQSAFYMRGCRSLGIEIKSFVFIVIEKEPPYESVVYELGAQSLAIADAQITRLLPVWQQCVTAKSWPGYGDEIKVIDLAAWMARKRE